MLAHAAIHPSKVGAIAAVVKAATVFVIPPPLVFWLDYLVSLCQQNGAPTPPDRLDGINPLVNAADRRALLLEALRSAPEGMRRVAGVPPDVIADAMARPTGVSGFDSAAAAAAKCDDACSLIRPTQSVRTPSADVPHTERVVRAATAAVDVVAVDASAALCDRLCRTARWYLHATTLLSLLTLGQVLLLHPDLKASGAVAALSL